MTASVCGRMRLLGRARAAVFLFHRCGLVRPGHGERCEERYAVPKGLTTPHSQIVMVRLGRTIHVLSVFAAAQVGRR